MPSSVFDSVFREIREYTNTLSPHPGPFQDLDNCYYCQELDLLTFESHPATTWTIQSLIDNQPQIIRTTTESVCCCQPILVHVPISYKVSGWFPHPNKPFPHIYMYYKGEWCVYAPPK
jgi:hypothetical protein